eukprot:scpid72377/ scgid27881/ Nudix hydrolase 8
MPCGKRTAAMASVLHSKGDPYHGVTVNLIQECPEEKRFEDCLIMSLEEWKAGKRRGVWLQIGVANSYCIQIADKHGFTIHHAQPGYVMMTKWLPTDEPNLLPGYASHYIGVSGLVVDDQNQILLIQDKYSYTNEWKLPGGAMDPGENIDEAVAREVLEETGIQAEFITIVSMRHLPDYLHSRGDINIVCHLRAKTSAIKKCEHEIHACKWMKIEKFLSMSKSDGLQEQDKYKVQSYLNQQKHGLQSTPHTISNTRFYTPEFKGEKVEKEAMPAATQSPIKSDVDRLVITMTSNAATLWLNPLKAGPD